MLRAVLSRCYAYIRLIICGFGVGLADLVPGVSGGTMAYLLGIYPRLLQAVAGLLPSRPLPDWLRRIDLRFLIPFVAGALLAVFSLTRVIDFPELLRTNPVPWQALFSGLIAGSIAVFLIRGKRLCVISVGMMVAAFTAGMLLVFLVPTELASTKPILFASGFIAAGAMLVPGISGSYLLFVVGLYETVLDALGKLYTPVLVPFLAGAALGFAICARTLAALVVRHERFSLAVINGLLLASLFRLWPLSLLLPGAAPAASGSSMIPWALLLCGLVSACLLYQYCYNSSSAIAPDKP